VWAPKATDVRVHVIYPFDRLIPLKGDKWYWTGEVDGVSAGTRYFFNLDGVIDRPDPASRFQPDGVHGASEVIDHSHFAWTDDAWEGMAQGEMILYELHIGAFSPEGTFAAAIPRLGEITDLGINTVDVMPVAQFPGDRNWGYDGAYPFAVQSSFGGPDSFKAFVDAAHRTGLSVILDVVYNHLGPEGNYLGEFGPYFTDRYRTPWGSAVNFDGSGSDPVRRYFIENAVAWFRDYHVDGLRIDAIHGIYDMSAWPFLMELAEAVDEYADRSGRRCLLIAESDLNDARVIRPRSRGGYGFDAQWSDDFHHAIHTLLTGETTGYYADFGRIEHLVTALRDGYVYSGQYSRYRDRRHGNSSADRPADQFVVFLQNHDQVGNRFSGDRLSRLVPFESLKLAAGALLCSPFVPMLFMGEEYGEESPFLYFVSFGDKDLVGAVRTGRAEEFDAFGWRGELPDPQDRESFERSKIDWEVRKTGWHGSTLDYYRELLRLRREIPALVVPRKDGLKVSGSEEDRTVLCHRQHDESEVFFAMNFSDVQRWISIDILEGAWVKRVDSSDDRWSGPGSLSPERWEPGDELVIRPSSIVLYEKDRESR
jgi:maltooligosyltrehalose trehalohydrolase